MVPHDVYESSLINGPSKESKKLEEAIARSGVISYWYARSALKGPFIAGEAAIKATIFFPTIPLDYQFRFNRDICSFDKLAKYPAYALAYAVSIGGRFPEGEPAMKASPRIWKRYLEFISCPNDAYFLAKDHGPSKELEKVIATNANYSLAYAVNVLKGPFPLGEPQLVKTKWTLGFIPLLIRKPSDLTDRVISNYAILCYDYALYALNGPFVAGEKAIAETGDLLGIPLDYQFRFNRDVCSFDKLAKYPAYALAHAVSIGSRFPEGEPAMSKSPRIWKRYQEFLNDTQRSI